MPSSAAATVKEYLDSLSPDRRAVISAARKLVKAHLPPGFREQMAFGAIWWVIPLSRFPRTYNGQPLGIVSLASQKNYCALHLMGCYMNPPALARLQKGFKAAGKKLDMGKACVRFKSLDDLAVEPIAELLGAFTPERWMSIYEASRQR